MYAAHFDVTIISLFRGEYFVAGEMSQSTPVVERRQWLQKPFNYDNVGYAMITLFAVQTTEGWVA